LATNFGNGYEAGFEFMFFLGKTTEIQRAQRYEIIVAILMLDATI
jgi:hypothetical protein